MGAYISMNALLMRYGKFVSILLIVMTCSAQSAFARSRLLNIPKKHSFYFYWGYNRAFYSNTNLHFSGPKYDFTVYRLKATDRPSPFGTVYINPVTFTVPQYNIRLGFFLTNRLHLSLGMDHMKYVVTEGQATTLSGVVTREASSRYSGSYLNKPVVLDRELLQFEHTNGFNFSSLDLEYLQPVKTFWKKRLAFSWNIGLGGVWVVTKTDVRVFGDGLDNDFHVAGYALAAKTGPRLDVLGRAFLAAEVKGGYATLPSVLVKNAAPELGDHNVMFLQYYVVAGYNFRLW